MNSVPFVAAINFDVRHKMTSSHPAEDWMMFNNGFRNVSLSLPDFDAAIAAGHSFAPCHLHVRHPKFNTDGSPKLDQRGEQQRTSFRCDANYLRTSVIAIDLDRGELDLEGLRRDTFFHEHGTYAYTTTSSTPEFPRIRAVFVVEKPVQRLDNYRALKRAIASHFASDPCDRNPMQAYAGNSTPSFACIRAPENFLPLRLAKELVADTLRRQAEERRRQQEIAQARMDQMSEYGDFPTPGDVAEMLSYMPVRQDYMGWIKTLMAVHDVYPGEEGIALCEAWSPGRDGEIGAKFRSFGHTTVSILFLVAAASRRGYIPPWERDQKKRKLYADFIASCRR